MLKYDHGAWRDAVGVELRGDYLAHLLGGRGHLRLRNEYICIYIYIYIHTYIYIYILYKDYDGRYMCWDIILDIGINKDIAKHELND